MLRHLLLTIFIFLFFTDVFLSKATNNFPIGARSAGLAHTSATLSDVWSTHNNQAGLAFLEKPEAGLYYENRFLVPELSLQGAAFAMPVKNGAFGVSYSRFGFNLYNENKVGLAYAQKFSDKLAASVQLNYMHTFIAENYGNKGFLSAEVGMLYKITNELKVGVHIFNPTRTKLSEYDNERIPTIMRLGLQYDFSDKLFIATEFLKDTDHDLAVKFGMEYHIVESIYLRAGVSTNPWLNAFGVGILLGDFRLDIASSFHSVLGYSPQASLNYRF